MDVVIDRDRGGNTFVLRADPCDLRALYTAMSPLALATFGGEATMSTGKAFLKSYAGVCLSGVMIILACIIFTAMASTGTPAIEGGSPVSMVWSYLQDVAFNMVMLTVMIFTSNAVVKEMFGL